jgi:hypothetical protein
MKNQNTPNPTALELSAVSELALRAKAALKYGQAADVLDELRSLLLTDRLEAQAGRRARGANARGKISNLRIGEQRAEQVGRDAWVDLIAKLEVVLGSWDHVKAVDITEYLLGCVVEDWTIGLRGYLKREVFDKTRDKDPEVFQRVVQSLLTDGITTGSEGGEIDEMDSLADPRPIHDSPNHPFWRSK